jgi:hypothetical protein
MCFHLVFRREYSEELIAFAHGAHRTMNPKTIDRWRRNYQHLGELLLSDKGAELEKALHSVPWNRHAIVHAGPTMSAADYHKAITVWQTLPEDERSSTVSETQVRQWAGKSSKRKPKLQQEQLVVEQTLHSGLLVQPPAPLVSRAASLNAAELDPIQFHNATEPLDVDQQASTKKTLPMETEQTGDQRMSAGDAGPSRKRLRSDDENVDETDTAADPDDSQQPMPRERRISHPRKVKRLNAASQSPVAQQGADLLLSLLAAAAPQVPDNVLTYGIYASDVRFAKILYPAASPAGNNTTLALGRQLDLYPHDPMMSLLSLVKTGSQASQEPKGSAVPPVPLAVIQLHSGPALYVHYGDARGVGMVSLVSVAKGSLVWIPDPQRTRLYSYATHKQMVEQGRFGCDHMWQLGNSGLLLGPNQEGRGAPASLDPSLVWSTAETAEDANLRHDLRNSGIQFLADQDIVPFQELRPFYGTACVRRLKKDGQFVK